MEIPEIPGWSYDKRKELGIAYAMQVEDVRSGRDTLLEQTYKKCADNYEGKAPPRNFPWPNANNSVIPITPTHVDAIHSRLYNTATGQDPMHTITAWGTGEIVDGITVEQFSRHLQNFSKWLEFEEIPVRDILEEALMIMVKYGDVLLYCPWVNRKVLDHTWKGGEWVEEERDLLNKPMVSVIHPQNFYIPIHETSRDAVQTAKFIGYDWELDLPTLRYWANLGPDKGGYDKKTADELEALLAPQVPQDKEKQNFFPMTGDRKDWDELQEKREELVGVERRRSAGTLKMVHVFAREDLQGNGLESEINFHLHPGTGLVPRIAYNHYEHKMRPFVHLRYAKRDGIFYSIGVPEMLFNIQAILNQTMRDIMDNNKVQNTKIFLARRGGPIDLDMRVYPSRVIFVDDIAKDFTAMDLGSGKQITSVQDIVMMQQWGERRTGISDYNLGQEKGGRTPATTTLALLEEANKRIDMVVRRMRDGLSEFWGMILGLYAQYGASSLTRSVTGLSGGEALDRVWAAMSVDDIRKRVVVQSRASTQFLNRTTTRQEALAIFGQTQAYYQQIYNLATMLASKPSPVIEQLLKSMLKGGHKVMERFLDTFDEKDQADLNPDFPEMLEGGVDGIVPQGAGQGDQVGPALGQAPGLEGATGPVNAPGRPPAGLPRVPGTGTVPPGEIELAV